MKALKSYAASHRDEIYGAIVLVLLLFPLGVLFGVLHLALAFHYAFGMAFGVVAMLLMNVVAHSNRIDKP